MTLSSTATRVAYAGDGATVTFPVPFRFLENEHVAAVLRDAGGGEAAWTEGTHYTLSGAGAPSGGTLTVATDPADHTPDEGATLVIRRRAPATQETDLPEGGAFPSAALEDALDKLTMLAQQHDEALARALVYPVTDAAAGATLPNETQRAGRYLAFDGDGAPIASSGPAGDSDVPVSPFIETLLDDADADAARTTLGLGTAAVADIEELEQAEGFVTGDVKCALRAAAPEGWLALDGATLGDTGSGAAHTGNAYAALYVHLWANLADAEAPVAGGRGASAGADWSAGKTLAMPDGRGRAFIGAGSGDGLTARTLGDAGGAETVALAEANLPAHTHGAGTLAAASGGSHSHTYPASTGGSTGANAAGHDDDAGTASTGSAGDHSHSISGATGATGSGTAHANMPPWLALNWFIKT
ncbi:MAG: hypothetical protein AB7N54_13035 [Alphaproteobacteria bacterium]